MQYFDTVGRAMGKPAAVIYRDYFNHAYAGNIRPVKRKRCILSLSVTDPWG